MSDTKLTLSYFPIGGRAEAIRLTAAIGGIAFTNNSIAFPDFMAAKNANPTSESMPFGQVPVLQMEKDGESSYITQSDAILRYFGKLAGMYPTDELEALRVDEFTSILQDLITPLAMTVRGAVKTHIGETDWTQEEKIEIRKRWLSADMPKYLSKLEESLKSSTSGWLVGDSVTIADVRIFVDLNWIIGGILDGIPTNALENYPRCLALMEKVKSIEKVKEWKEEHPMPYQTFDFKP